MHAVVEPLTSLYVVASHGMQLVSTPEPAVVLYFPARHAMLGKEGED